MLRSIIILVIFLSAVARSITCGSQSFWDIEIGQCQKCDARISACYGCIDNNGTLLCTTCWNPYYLTDKKCLRCPVGCNICENNNSSPYCHSCNSRFYVQNGKCQSCPSGCYNCIGHASSVKCNQCLWQNSPTYHCLACSAGCYRCNNYTAPLKCTSCFSRYYRQDGQCLRCPKDCNTCSNSTGYIKCTKCQWTNYPNPDACPQCPAGCNRCNNKTGSLQCEQCYSGFISQYRDICKRICDSVDCDYCLDDASECTQCLPGFHLQATKICKPCTTPNCYKCPNSTYECIQCASGFDLLSNQLCKRICDSVDCDYCLDDASECTQCLPGFHLQATKICKPCTTPNCYKCPNSTYECIQCVSGFDLLPNQLCKRICDSVDCDYCPNSTYECTQCVSGFDLLANKTCKRICDSINCDYCPDSANECIQCMPGFQLTNKACHEECGDSIVSTLPCDLPLGVLDDGCTDSCQVQKGYECENWVITPGEPQKSQCWFIGSQSVSFIQFLSSDKSSYYLENKMKIVFQIETAFPSCEEDGKLKELFVFNDTRVVVEEMGFDRSTLRLTFIVSYAEDIEGWPYLLIFQPSPAINKAYSGTPVANFSGKTFTNTPIFLLIAYPDAAFTMAELVRAFSIIVCLLALAVCIVGAFSTKLAGLEIFLFAIQYTWLAILWLPDYLPLPIFMVTYMRFASGYNIPLLESSEESDAQTLAFGLSNHSFLSNYNLSLLPTVLPLLSAFYFKIAFCRAQQSEKLKMQERYRKCLQLLMYSCLFNLQYFLSCMVIYLKGQVLLDPASFATIALQLLIFSGTAVRFIYKSASFNRFRLQFGQKQIKYNHYAFHLLNLIISAFLLSLLPEYPWLPALPQLLLLLYTLVIGPYKTSIENFRSMFYLLLMLNATAFKTYIWYVQPDHTSFGQYGGLIVMQVALLLGIGWAAYELKDYWTDKKNAKNSKKQILDRFMQEQEVRNQMNEQEKARTMMSVIPNHQTPLEYLQEQSDYDDTTEVMRQKIRKRQQTVTDVKLDFEYLDSISPVKQMRKKVKKKEEDKDKDKELQEYCSDHQGETLVLKEEQKIELVEVLKQTKVHFQLQNAIAQGQRLNEYDNPLFMEEYNKIGKEEELSDCVEEIGKTLELPETPQSLKRQLLIKGVNDKEK